MARRRKVQSDQLLAALREIRDPARAFLGTEVGAATAVLGGLATTSPLWIEEMATVIQRFSKAIADGWGGILPGPPNLPDWFDPDIPPEPPAPWEIPEEEKEEAGLGPAPSGYTWVRLRQDDGTFQYKLVKRGALFYW